MDSPEPLSPKSQCLSALPPRGAALLDAVQSGFPVEWVDEVAARLSLSRRALAPYLAVSESTLRRRASQGHLNACESDRLYRLISTLDLCVELFEGNAQAAADWMLQPQFGLNGQRPIDLLSTLAGTEAVRDLIGRLEHGVVV
ncbi:putative toxin-antitoxin system antitoxin component [compost metagenome]